MQETVTITLERYEDLKSSVDLMVSSKEATQKKYDLLVKDFETGKSTVVVYTNWSRTTRVLTDDEDVKEALEAFNSTRSTISQLCETLLKTPWYDIIKRRRTKKLISDLL